MQSEANWEAENNARILMQAEAIKANAKQYAGAKKVLSSQAAAITKVIKPAAKKTAPAKRK